MDREVLLAELRAYYLHEVDQKAARIREKAWDIFDHCIPRGLSAMDQKGMQYDLIPDYCEPVIFKNTFFYFESGSVPITDKNNGIGKWCYTRNIYRYDAVEDSLRRERDACRADPLYTFCGEYGDELYHFAFDMKEVIRYGLRGVYEKNLARYVRERDTQRAAYYRNACKGLLALRRLSERFARKALDDLTEERDEKQREKLGWIARTAMDIPWNPPRTFREGLNTVAFLQKGVPTLEGGSISGMGRLDQFLLPLYEADLKNGCATKEQIFEDICQFLLLWDAHWDPDWKQVSSEFNDRGFTYTLGGCDRDGHPSYNKLTALFLKANSEMKVIYPKIKCRFDENAPDWYFDAINEDIAKGRTTILYQNDASFIPALLREGLAAEDARDYYLLGCWEPVLPNATNEHCGYVNLIKILERTVYGDFNREGIDLKLEDMNGAENFEEVYARLVRNIRAVLASRCNVAKRGRSLWNEVDPHLVYSSVFDSCLESGCDFLSGGARYTVDEIICAGFPNVVDSLCAIRELCFEKKAVSLKAYLDAVRSNWHECEKLRQMALKCSYFGDETPESSTLASQLHRDIYGIIQKLPVLWNGKAALGYMLFMEMHPWSRKLRATPDGRRDQDYFARGLTPSALHRIDSVSSAVQALNPIDPALIAANSVVNLTVPFEKLPLKGWRSFLRAVARSNVQALQLNCVSKEELMDAQLHPDKHQDIVVRVCGFSAKFVSLSPELQKEYLERNFFER